MGSSSWESRQRHRRVQGREGAGGGSPCRCMQDRGRRGAPDGGVENLVAPAHPRSDVGGRPFREEQRLPHGEQHDRAADPSLALEIMEDNPRHGPDRGNRRANLGSRQHEANGQHRDRKGDKGKCEADGLR